MTKYSLIINIVLIGIVMLLFSMWRSSKNNAVRWEQNYNSATTSIKYLKSENGQVYAQNGVLKLTIVNLKDGNDSLVKKIKNLNVRLRNVISTSENNIVIRDTIRTFLTDTIINNIKVPFVDWSNRWNSFKYIQYPNDSIDVYFSSNVKILQVVFKEKRGFKFWTKKFWQKRKILQDITSDNPNASITYSRSIQIQR